MFAFVKKHLVFFAVLGIFLALLLRDPFSQRTLVPNFEPYPDTIHYINPARSFVEGYGLEITREGRTLQTNVPPLYSIVLIPLFYVYNDPRMAFFTNVILALLSYLFFYKILAKLVTTNDQRPTTIYQRLSTNDYRLTTNDLIVAITLFLYVTNYFVYWYPSLAMSENLTLTLFMIGVWLLVKPVSPLTSIGAGVLSVLFYMTKYASIPITGFYFITYLVKIVAQVLHMKNKKQRATLLRSYMGLLFASAGVLFLLFSWWEWTAKGSTLLVTLFNSLFPQQSSAPTVMSGGWFSFSYMEKYLPQYLRAMAGGVRMRFLWDDTPIVPLYVGIPAIVGLLWAMVNKHSRLLAGGLVAMLISSIVFMSTFYSQDMRYLYHAIPTLLIGFALFWNNITNTVTSCWLLVTGKKQIISNQSKIPYILIIAVLLGIFGYYSITNAMRLKSAVMVNLKYAETPWYYISVLELNKYFAKEPPPSKKFPVVISSMIPYYIDFYSNGNYSLLPMSLHQEFRNSRKETWGDYNYSDLIDLYRRILYSGYPLYVHNYGLGNEKVLHDDFQKIKDAFTLELVHQGCVDACNIWKVTEKDPITFLKKVK